jgi:IS605 OrfB family transposase
VLHKLTTRLANCYGIIGIEDLHLKGLLKNRRLSRSFSDAALGNLLNLLTSKVEQRGGQVMKVGRFFPSSKTCHDDEVKRWVQESRSFYLKSEEETPSGLLVTLRVRLESEVLQWLLSWGRHVRVLEPESLRQRLVEEAEGMLRNNQHAASHNV